MDRAVDSNLATSMIDEIERASKSCMGGIFLFTKEDETIRGENVIFEAGYFMHAKGADKTLMIRVEGAKMPGGMGGRAYLSLQNRDDISPIEQDLEKFIVNNL